MLTIRVLNQCQILKDSCCYSHPNYSLLPKLLFWQDVTEYGAAEDRAADRLLRMCNAWAIYNKYISEDSPYNVGKSFIIEKN